MTNNQINAVLEENSFVFDSELGIWIEKEKEHFNYNDGDVHENYILDVVKNANDCSVLSNELANHIIDWPSQYHLTPKRANLLRPFSEKFKGKRVLEIGCGCGAITRFVAECGAELISVEGSKRRAAITRQRCKDLNNVTVICSSSQNLPDIGDFDYILLIGVLEYAQCFLGNDGQAILLKSCKARLKSTGSLFIAIENQLGLKYLAGANEDHLGIPMVGVNDAYHKGGVRTFGRDELKSIIQDSGFKKIEEFLPFPDYKLPSLLITPVGHEKYSNTLYPLISETCFKEAQRPKSYTFSLEQASKLIWKNNLGADLSNSFLMIVTEEGEPLSSDNLLAWYYSDVRLNGQNKKISFSINDGDFRANSFALNGDVISFDKYYQGESLWLSLAKITNKHGWLCEDVLNWTLKWIDVILTKCGEKNNIRWDLELPGVYLDATPFNIICGEADNYIFDLELNADKPLLLSQLVFRGVHNSLLRLTSISPTTDLDDYNIYNLTRRVVLSVFPDINNSLFENLLLEEIDLISNEINVDKNDLREKYMNSYFTVRNSLDDLTKELVNAYKLNEDLKLSNGHNDLLKEINNKLQAQLDEQRAIDAAVREDLKNKSEYIKAIHSSRTWKLVAAFKRVLGAFRN